MHTASQFVIKLFIIYFNIANTHIGLEVKQTSNMCIKVTAPAMVLTDSLAFAASYSNLCHIIINNNNKVA